MKINRLSIPANHLNKGLFPIVMDRIGDVVVIAGKNGAGKTRLLDIVVDAVNNRVKTQPNIDILMKNIHDHENAIATRPTDPNLGSWKINLDRYKAELLADSYFSVDNRREGYLAVKFVPNNLNLINPDKLTREQKDKHYEMSQNIRNVTQVNDFACSYIQYQSDNNFYATHGDFQGNPHSPEYVASYN